MAFTWNPANLTATTKRKAIERFWKFVNMTDGCWLWTGLVGKDGYGRIRPGTGTKKVRTDRFSYELHRGPIPEGMFVLHTCDIRPCVNPAHLFLGTSRDNIDDMVTKGRSLKGRDPFSKCQEQRVRGERHGQAKLTAEQVVEIRRRRANGEICRSIAEAFGLSKKTVQYICSGKAWKHIPLTVPGEGR